MKPKTGVELIAVERKRQMDDEGWTAKHDDEHDDHSLALAAAAYAAPEVLYSRGDYAESVSFYEAWPRSWATGWDKRPRFRDTHKLMDAGAQGKSVRIRALVKAGALIAAEIDRLQRMKKRTE